LRKVILPLFSALIRHIWSPEPNTVLPSKERHGCNGASPAKVNKNYWGLEHWTLEDRLSELALFILEKGTLTGGSYRCV